MADPESKSCQPEIELVVQPPRYKTNIKTPSQHDDDYDSIIVMRRIKLSLKSMLTKFHAGYFRISLSLGGQALLWKTMIKQTDNDNTTTLRRILQMIHPMVFILLWSLALITLILLSVIYILRCWFYFKMVKLEFLHHVGVNYLFVPWISSLLLLQSAPFVKPEADCYLILWWVFAVPVLALDVKIYGEWFTRGKRFLSANANPTSQLSVIGNLIGAQAAANMGWKESAVCLFSLGMVHYLVLFVTLYQRLTSKGDKLPVMLRPVFFLFFAAPSVASLAWEAISGAFDTTSKMLFFLSLFLFTSLVCRPALFRRSMRRFNVAWWAYSFPLTMLALASTEYAEQVKGGIADVLMLLLLAISVLVSLGLIFFTLFNTKMLLPENDPISSLLNHLPTTSN